MGSNRRIGNYEVDTEHNFVRLRTKSGKEYEYLVSTELYGDQAHIATLMFERGYERGKSDLRRNLRELLGAGK
jgi:hypothetical protein